MPTDVQYQFCSFRESLISKVLANEPPEAALFIFPTESNKHRAGKEFQSSWQFTRTRFLTMTEFQNLLFLPQKPLLQEEKRTLTFYGSLTAEDKAFFRINNYFQAVELAHNAFELWEELNEECAEESLIDDEYFRLRGCELFDWQKNTWEHLVKIREQYRQFITARGFDDPIFAFQARRVTLAALSEYRRFVFVNQFYYTQLEKTIIHHLTHQDRQVVVWYQLPKECVDTKTLDAKPFQLKELHQFPVMPIQIYETRNDFTMLISLIDVIHEQGVHHVVDVSPHRSPLLQFLEWKKFDLSHQLRFHSTTVYRFIKVLHTLLDGLLYEPTRKKLLVPLQHLLDAVLCREFLRHFLNPEETEGATLAVLDQLIDQDYQYLDLEGEALQMLSQASQNTALPRIIGFLSRTLQIQSIADLIDWLEAEDGLRLHHFLSAEEQEVTHLRETLYRALSDFQSIEKLGLIPDWHEYFPSGESELESAKVATGLLRLFLDYFRTRSTRMDIQIPNPGRIELTDLIETRNMSYDNVAIWYVVEGALPASPQPPFLFTENQRKVLRLKSYEEIKEREKYYFYRLILTSNEICIFTQRNIEQNVDVSSFVEELRLAFPDQVRYHRIEAEYYRATFSGLLRQNPSVAGLRKNPDEAFFRLTLDPTQDFPANRLDLTPYSFKDLKNPFYFYLRHIAGIREFAANSDPDLSRKLIGNLAHQIMDLVWEQIEKSNAGGMWGYNFTHVEKELRRAIDLLFRDAQLYYQMPLNYAAIYFREIILPMMRDGILGFFKFLEQKNIHNKTIHVIPEGQTPKADKIPKTWLAESENALKLQVRIKGRADLRIEIPDEQRYYIFDYKTGDFDKNQLLLYELYYYLIENPDLTENLQAYFYDILNDKSHDLWTSVKSRRDKNSKQQMLQTLRQNFLNSLDKIAREGFGLPAQKQHLNGYAEITRKDLFLQRNSKLGTRQTNGLSS